MSTNKTDAAMKEYIKPTVSVEEAVMVSMIADSINVAVSDESADDDLDVLAKDRFVYGSLWW